MAKWEELPIADRAQYMRVAVQNGYRDIRSIREAYNRYDDGGEILDFNVATLSAKQKSNMDEAWKYFTSNGYSSQATAAIMANGLQESSFYEDKVQPDGDRAVGIYQMHGKRLKDYNKFLTENNLKDSSLSQQKYMHSVIKGNRSDFYMDSYNQNKKAIEDLKAKKKRAAWEEKDLKDKQEYHKKIYGTREKEGRLYPISDLREALGKPELGIDSLTTVFSNTIERPGKPKQEQRIRYAKGIFNHHTTKKTKK